MTGTIKILKATPANRDSKITRLRQSRQSAKVRSDPRKIEKLKNRNKNRGQRMEKKQHLQNMEKSKMQTPKTSTIPTQGSSGLPISWNWETICDRYDEKEDSTATGWLYWHAFGLCCRPVQVGQMVWSFWPAQWGYLKQRKLSLSEQIRSLLISIALKQYVVAKMLDSADAPVFGIKPYAWFGQIQESKGEHTIIITDRNSFSQQYKLMVAAMSTEMASSNTITIIDQTQKIGQFFNVTKMRISWLGTPLNFKSPVVCTLSSCSSCGIRLKYISMALYDILPPIEEWGHLGFAYGSMYLVDLWGQYAGSAPGSCPVAFRTVRRNIAHPD